MPTLPREMFPKFQAWIKLHND